MTKKGTSRRDARLSISLPSHKARRRSNESRSHSQRRSIPVHEGKYLGASPFVMHSRVKTRLLPLPLIWCIPPAQHPRRERAKATAQGQGERQGQRHHEATRVGYLPWAAGPLASASTWPQYGWAVGQAAGLSVAGTLPLSWRGVEAWGGWMDLGNRIMMSNGCPIKRTQNELSFITKRSTALRQHFSYYQWIDTLIIEFIAEFWSFQKDFVYDWGIHSTNWPMLMCGNVRLRKVRLLWVSLG